MSRTAAENAFTETDLAAQTAGVICREDKGGDRRNSGDLQGHQSGHGQLAGGQVLLHDPPGAGS